MRLKLYILTVSLFFNAFISASKTLNDIPIEQDKVFDNLSLDDEAKVFSISGNERGIKLNAITFERPSSSTIKNLNPFSKQDKYALQLLDENKKTIMIYGLGNPFYIHAQHIDFEDRDFFGGYIEANFKVAFPKDSDISYLILLEQNGEILRKINEISLDNK